MKTILHKNKLARQEYYLNILLQDEAGNDAG